MSSFYLTACINARAHLQIFHYLSRETFSLLRPATIDQLECPASTWNVQFSTRAYNDFRFNNRII